MWCALIIAIIVIAGWIFLANGNATARGPNGGTDDYVPVNAYDNPYDTNENNDRPFESDDYGDASDASSGDDPGGCDSDSSSD